jgi:hypothetical protein
VRTPFGRTPSIRRWRYVPPVRVRREQRFPGAGGSAEREFNRLTRQNIRSEWKVWALAAAMTIGFAVWSFYAGRVSGRLFAAVSGALFGAFFVIYSLGGHISAFRWHLGAEGERETGEQIESLGTDWHCEHDLEHEHGNWDHVLVGPPGVFLLDSKLLHGTSAVGADALRSGRVLYRGNAFRSGARRVNAELERKLGFRASWVQAVVVIWGDFPQSHHEERDVVYLRGEQLTAWLEGLPAKLNGPQRAAYVTALREVRESLQGTSDA